MGEIFAKRCVDSSMDPFVIGFIVGCIVTVAIFLIVFGVAFWLKRWRNKKFTVTETYARVFDDSVDNESGMEMTPPSFVIGDEEVNARKSQESLGQTSTLELSGNPVLSPQEFEANWLAFQCRENLNFTLTFGDANIEEILSSQRIKCMASGNAGKKQKYYFFAREELTNAPILMEVFILPQEREMAAEIRCESVRLLPEITSYVKQTMRPFSKLI